MALNIKDLLFRKLSKQQIEAIKISAHTADECGYNIYLIGGTVRDLIIDKPVTDIDIAVESNAVIYAKELEKTSSCLIINTQENLKTAKVKFSNGVEIDFASTRQENYEYSGRLPIACNFGCELKDEVKRRDFTINTLAIKLTGDNEYTIIDYCGGYNDILKKQIKILHNNSFIDDPSRIIRTLKFALRFDFKIEPETYGLMQEYLKNINTEMPLERIKNELKQYFAISSNKLYDKIISTNAYKLISTSPLKKIYIERIKEIENYNIINANDIPFIYFAALCINSDYADKRLNLTGNEIRILKQTENLLNAKLTDKSPNTAIYSAFQKCCVQAIACCYIFAEDKTAADKYLQELKNIKVEINGNDLISLGLTPSCEFTKIFNIILEKKLAGEMKSKKEEIQFVKEYTKEHK